MKASIVDNEVKVGFIKIGKDGICLWEVDPTATVNFDGVRVDPPAGYVYFIDTYFLEIDWLDKEEKK